MSTFINEKTQKTLSVSTNENGNQRKNVLMSTNENAISQKTFFVSTKLDKYILMLWIAKSAKHNSKKSAKCYAEKLQSEVDKNCKV